MRSSGCQNYLSFLHQAIKILLVLLIMLSGIRFELLSLNRNFSRMGTALALASGSPRFILQDSKRTCSTKSSVYQPPPSHFQLEKVVVIHRHGDRTPIERNAGPNFPERKSMPGRWAATLPSLTTLQKLEQIGTIHFHSIQEKQSSRWREVYTGWDQKEIPYGQLTEKGVQQLIHLGQRLRSRYGGHLFPLDLTQADQYLYCRSTFICRTIHSARSLLVGLYNLSSPLPPSELPSIHVRPKSEETLYPQVDGRCSEIWNRRVQIEPLTHLPYYSTLSSKIRQIFGYSDQMLPWLNLQEILVCYYTYGMLSFFPEISEEEIQQIGQVLGGIWGVLYRDPRMVQLGMGRFVHELMADLEEEPNHHYQRLSQTFESLRETTAPTHQKKLLLYSAHDSTLIPLLCMFQHYDDRWPDYAANIIIEIARNVQDQQRYVRVLYNDRAATFFDQQTGEEAVEKKEWIRYERFQNLLSLYAISPEDYRKVC